MNLRKLSIKTKLLSGFSIITLIAMVTAAIGANAVHSEHAAFSSYVSQTAARLAIANEAIEAANARAIAARNLVLVRSAADRDLEKAAVTVSHEKLGAKIAEMDKALDSMQGVSEEERRLFKDFEGVEAKYSVVALAIVKLALEDHGEEAIVKMNSECRPLLAALLKSGQAYSQFVSAKARDDVAAADAAASARMEMMTSAAVLALVLAVVLGLVITRAILRPIQRAVEVAKTVAAGDLRSNIDAGAQDETGVLLGALKSMNEALVSIVGHVRDSSENIALGSSQIATGNADLSQRTEQQSSSLQQTAASMEQMTATVKGNADTASQATQLAGSASTAAQRGGEVVAQVVTTMQEINASSRKINDIIGLIDSIAFQTNILALNAAVEAARAGEQGRGFAVVAAEVRSLAQRSASAAKDIKTLIGESVDKVQEGSKLVGDAQSTMADIVSRVQRVTDLITEISAATSEQTTGISQVSTAVSQLDEVTQQNAALVEQSAAAAEGLRQQSDKLAQVVSVFKLA